MSTTNHTPETLPKLAKALHAILAQIYRRTPVLPDCKKRTTLIDVIVITRLPFTTHGMHAIAASCGSNYDTINSAVRRLVKQGLIMRPGPRLGPNASRIYRPSPVAIAMLSHLNPKEKEEPA